MKGLNRRVATVPVFAHPVAERGGRCLCIFVVVCFPTSQGFINVLRLCILWASSIVSHYIYLLKFYYYFTSPFVGGVIC